MEEILKQAENYFINPLYYGLLLYIVIILLIIFCFQSFEMLCTEHIKFFVYSFTISSILSIVYRRCLEKHFRQTYNLDKTNLKIVDDIHKTIPNKNINMDILIPNQ